MERVEHPIILTIHMLPKQSGSGVSRCSMVVYLYSRYRPSSGVRRWHQYSVRGVGLLVGLWCWESLRRVGDAGDAVLLLDAVRAGARLRVSQCHRARSEAERGRGGGLARWGWRALAVQGLGDLRLPDPDKDRHGAEGRRPPRPGPERPTL